MMRENGKAVRSQFGATLLQQDEILKGPAGEGNPVDARAHFQTVLSIHPSHEGARKHLAEMDAEEERLLGLDEEEPMLEHAAEKAKSSRRGCLPLVLLAGLAAADLLLLLA